MIDTLTSLANIPENLVTPEIFPFLGTEKNPLFQLSGMGNLEDYKPMFILDELLALSDMSILAGEPKVGKSTLAKYLIQKSHKGNHLLVENQQSADASTIRMNREIIF